MIVSETSSFTPIPAGAYPAVCVRVIDLGTQEGKYGAKRKVMLTWEVPEVTVEDAFGAAKPSLISSTYTASLSAKASLRLVLESWRGKKFTAEELKGFDLKNVLGAGCYLSVIHSDDGAYANVGSVMPLPKGHKVEPVNPLIHMDLDNFDLNEFDKLSDKMREKIRLSPEYKAATGETPSPSSGPVAYDMDDDIPF